MSIDLPIPYERLNPKSISDRFWGNDPKQHFYARAKNIVLTGKFDHGMLLEIQEEYNGDLVADFMVQWKELLKEIVYQIAVDGVIDSKERAFFKEYILIFQITKDEASRIYRSGARRACLKLLQDTKNDGVVSEKELEKIQEIAFRFGLREFDVQEHHLVQVKKLVQAHFDDMVSDFMISDYEWEIFESYCEAMRASFTMDSAGRKAVEQARRHWASKYGALQSISVQNIKLKKDELVYLVAEAKWYEMRKNRGEPYQKLIRMGILYLTNDRVVMVSDQGDNQTVKWNAIHSVVMLSTAGFELEKIKGKSPTILIHKADDITWLTASTIAHRLCHGRIESL